MALGIDVADLVDLSASLNPAAPDPTLIVARHLGALGRYPDPARATAALAERIGVDRARLLLTNGGAEAISLAGALLGGMVDEPDFSLYPRTAPSSSRSLGGMFDRVPRWRSNPHSPSGYLAAPTDAAGVWDEAFWPMATGTWTRGDHRQESVVVGSLTKLLACPGLRAGYLLVPENDDGDRLMIAARERQPGWSVGGLVCEALPDLLDTVDLPGWQHQISYLRQQLVALLGSFGHRALAGDAPWVLVPEAGDLRARLALRGIVVRDCASFGLVDTVRIAVPSHENRLRLGAALETIA